MAQNRVFVCFTPSQLRRTPPKIFFANFRGRVFNTIKWNHEVLTSERIVHIDYANARA